MRGGKSFALSRLRGLLRGRRRLGVGGGGVGVPAAIRTVIDASTGDAVYFDTSDGSKMWQDSGETTPAANGADVQRVNAAYGTGNLVQASGTGSDTTFPDWDETNGLLDYPTLGGHVLGLALSSEADKYLAVVLRYDGTTENHLVGSVGSVSNIGIAQNGNAGAPTSAVGTPTILIDGSVVTTRDQVFDAFADGLPHVFEARGLDMTGYTQMVFGRLLSASATFNLIGGLGHIVYCDNPSAGEADAVRSALQATYA